MDWHSSFNYLKPFNIHKVNIQIKFSSFQKFGHAGDLQGQMSELPTFIPAVITPFCRLSQFYKSCTPDNFYLDIQKLWVLAYLKMKGIWEGNLLKLLVEWCPMKNYKIKIVISIICQYVCVCMKMRYVWYKNWRIYSLSFSKKKSDIEDCVMLALNTQNYLFTIVVIFFILQVQDIILDLKNKKLNLLFFLSNF